MPEDEVSNDQLSEKKKFKLPSLLLVIAWSIIFGGTAVIAYVVDGLFGSGQLRDEWASLTTAQGNILGQMITVYAAAFAAVVTPAIFSSKFGSLEDRLKKTAREIETLSQQTRSAFHTLNETALSQAGIKRTYNQADLGRSREIMRVMQAKTSEFAQTAKDRSRKWKKKEAFKGKWPNRQNYVELLLQHDMITREQFNHFMKILSSRRFTHGDAAQAANLIQLNDIAQSFANLQADFDDEHAAN